MRGGARPNSGRKKGGKNQATLEKEQMRDRLREKLKERWDDVIDAQLDKALGIKLEALDKKGEIIYKDPGPDTFAFKTLTEHAIDKPKESLELSGDEENPVELSVSIDKTLSKVYGDKSKSR